MITGAADVAVVRHPLLSATGRINASRQVDPNEAKLLYGNPHPFFVNVRPSSLTQGGLSGSYPQPIQSIKAAKTWRFL